MPRIPPISFTSEGAIINEWVSEIKNIVLVEVSATRQCKAPFNAEGLATTKPRQYWRAVQARGYWGFQSVSLGGFGAAGQDCARVTAGIFNGEGPEMQVGRFQVRCKFANYNRWV